MQLELPVKHLSGSYCVSSALLRIPLIRLVLLLLLSQVHLSFCRLL